MRRRIFLLSAVFILILGTSMTAYAQPKTMADGTVFDAEFYANTYADLKAAFGNDEEALYNHYVQHGKAEGRLACAEGTTVAIATVANDNFDAVYYAKNNPDVVAALGTNKDALYQHYINYGKKEGRLPNADAKVNTPSNAVVTQIYTGGSSSVIVPARNETTGNLVWVPIKGGTKYHTKSTCSNMDSPRQVSVETAEKNGYTPCKKCYR